MGRLWDTERKEPHIVAKDGKKKDKAAEPKSSNDGYNLVGATTAAPREDGDRFVTKDHVNELLLITPTEHVESIETVNGTKEAIRANIVVLDPTKPAKSETFDDALLFAGYVIGQLRPALNAGNRVVGTLIVDTANQKRGQNAPYRLSAPSDADVDVAKAYLDSLNPLR